MLSLTIQGLPTYQLNYALEKWSWTVSLRCLPQPFQRHDAHFVARADRTLPLPRPTTISEQLFLMAAAAISFGSIAVTWSLSSGAWRLATTISWRPFPSHNIARRSNTIYWRSNAWSAEISVTIRGGSFVRIQQTVGVVSEMIGRLITQKRTACIVTMAMRCCHGDERLTTDLNWKTGILPQGVMYVLYFFYSPRQLPQRRCAYTRKMLRLDWLHPYILNVWRPPTWPTSHDEPTCNAEEHSNRLRRHTTCSLLSLIIRVKFSI